MKPKKTEPKKTETTKEVEVAALNTEQVDFCILGTSPLIQNKMSLATMQELLYPSPKANEAERSTRLKHNPLQEFRDSIHESTVKGSPTYAMMPSKAFKKGIAQAAIDIPGNAKKAQLMRLVTSPKTEVALYGLPELYMTNVRQGGMTRTPDVRTRAIYPRWACIVTLSFDPKLVKTGTVTTLFHAAGTILGVGDDRPEKGGSCGQYTLVSYTDPAFVDIVKNGGREAQEEAIENPACYDRLTEQLLSWFQAQLIAREQTAPTKKRAA